MKRFSVPTVTLVVFSVLALGMFFISAGQEDMPFGGQKDVEFAKATWEAMEGYQEWKMVSGFYPGKSPHGKVLRIYYSMVNVDGKPYHIIVKDNYVGKDADVETVSQSPMDYMGPVTIMLQRDEGYDPDNNNWFWAKYNKDGSLDKNQQGMALAGRVAKGMNAGCIACHANAKGGDYLFSNDE